ncbi:MAG TPA: ethanolamine ammonia-lyase subunit EutB [Gemmatimonadales bacterium]|nr:ethanolamine ammonia-lyase subunit EutB [Gemmatimonadales bacterium]
MRADELRRALVLAGEYKDGDRLVGGADDAAVRADARRALGATRLREIDAAPLVEDGVTEALARERDRALAAETGGLTVDHLGRRLLSGDGPAWIERCRAGLSSEAIAAVVKCLSDDELGRVARAVVNPLPGPGLRIGAPGHLGSRIQPNSPGDDEDEILLSIFEGLAWGTGDVILGINPAADDVETIVRLERLLNAVVERLRLPTRTCVLSDIVTQARARERTRVDTGFQSLAGTSKALAGMVGLDVDGILDLARGFDGLYFETGQGSEVTNGAAEGVDMVTLEARTYGVARLIQRRTGAWTIVNDVAGFIGPEVFARPAQLFRACLEDTVMARLHGLTMGLDVCATFHMGIPPAVLQDLTARVVREAAPAYLMAVAGNADPMLGYLTTSFREHPRLRRLTGRAMTTPMAARLRELGAGPEDGHADTVASLYAAFARNGGDTRSEAVLRAEAGRKLAGLRERGWDLGHGAGPGHAPPANVTARLDAIYENARRALYARPDPAALALASPAHLPVRSEALDREDYLRHPRRGERIREEDTHAIRAMYPDRRPAVQVVVSDGLNANAVSENLGAVLPPLRSALAAAGIEVGGVDIVVENGRVRAGYHAGMLLGAEAVVHLIGERPGTGLDSLSAYLTYGRDAEGRPRFTPGLDHSLTTVIAGIHPRGKKPATAVEQIAAAVRRMLDERRSGVGRRGSPGRPSPGT